MSPINNNTASNEKVMHWTNICIGLINLWRFWQKYQELKNSPVQLIWIVHIEWEVSEGQSYWNAEGSTVYYKTVT